MSKEQTLQLPATIPSGFGSSPVVYNDQSPTPYVTFSHVTKRIYPRLAKEVPSLANGDPILVSPEPAKCVRVNPLKYFLVAREQFWAKFDQDNKIVKFFASRPDKSAGAREVMDVVAIVFASAKLLVPASIRFKGAQIPGVLPASRAFDEARTSAWFEKGEAFAATAGIDVPWARFTASTGRGPERETQPDAEGKTFRYQTLEKAAINPTTKEEYKLLLSFWNAPEFKQVFKDVCDSVAHRLDKAKAA